MSDGVFREKKGFTVVQNVMIRDQRLSMKARGLYTTIQSYITMPNKSWKKSEFLRMVREGEKAFESTWNELKAAGYLKVHMYSKSATWTVEYELLDDPVDGPHTYYYNSKGELVRTNEGKVEITEETSCTPKVDAADNSDETGSTPKPEETPNNDEAASLSDTFELKNTADNICCSVANDPEIRTETAYPQNRGNAEDSVSDFLRTPHYGTYAKGTYAEGRYAEGTYANGGNSNKDYIVNTVCNDCDINPSLNHSESKGMADKRKDSEYTVVLDLQERIGYQRTEEIERELQASGGIPNSSYPPNIKTIKEAIMALTEWDVYYDSQPRDEWHKCAFKLTVECLIEMAIAPGICEYKGASVTRGQVINQINGIYRNFHGTAYSLSLFAECIVDRFIEIMKETRVLNQKAYLKSLIWSSFSTYVTDWESYFHRSYYLGQAR